MRLPREGKPSVPPPGVGGLYGPGEGARNSQASVMPLAPQSGQVPLKEPLVERRPVVYSNPCSDASVTTASQLPMTLRLLFLGRVRMSKQIVWSAVSWEARQAAARAQKQFGSEALRSLEALVEERSQ